MADRARNMNPLLALLTLLLVAIVVIIGGCIVLGAGLHVLVEIASVGWDLI